jgi:hypothetical protein
MTEQMKNNMPSLAEEKAYWLQQTWIIDRAVKKAEGTGRVPEFLVNMRGEAYECLNALDAVK